MDFSASTRATGEQNPCPRAGFCGPRGWAIRRPREEASPPNERSVAGRDERREVLAQPGLEILEELGDGERLAALGELERVERLGLLLPGIREPDRGERDALPGRQ